MKRRHWLVVALVGVLLMAASELPIWDEDEDPDLSETKAEEVVRDYVAAVHDGDYAAAARVLARGPNGSIDDRDDLAPLGIEDVTVESVAEGLERYCQPGCAALTGLELSGPRGDRDTYKATVAFGEPRGHPLNRTLTVGADHDGNPYVRGLPPAGEGQIPRS